MIRMTGASMAALTLALGVSGAMAQTTAPRTAPTAPSANAEATKVPVTGQIVVQDANTILTKDLVGQTVFTIDKSTKIGSISDLILSKDAKNVEGFVIGVGGFLGLGEKSVALKMDRLQMTHDQEGVHLTMDMKKEELANAPSFKSKREQDAEKLAAERAHNRPEVPRVPQPGSPMQRPGTN
jgi:sporulation protein YlmC with PRC-barrel domain